MTMNKTPIALLSLVLLYFLGCTPGKTISKADKDKELNHFASLLIGKFSSQKQSEKDTAYYHITLSMARIWEDRKDGIWLYVEQALATKKDKPYRQRVYKLGHPSKDLFTSEIYSIKNAKEVIGLQDDPARRGLLKSDSLDLKEGCTVFLRYENGIYRGGTEGNSCLSDLRGARYATTKITLTDGVLESWDQGFDADGKQVWGATGGGYVFIKE